MSTTTPLTEHVTQMVAMLKKNPQMGKAIMRASTRLVGGTQVAANVRKLPQFFVDEPAELGGTNTGPNPVELLLVALGACQEIAYSLFAPMMGIELDSVAIELKGQIDLRGAFGVDESVPAGFQKIWYETRIESKADPQAIQRLIRMVESGCPTLDTLKRPMEIVGSVLLNGQPVVAEATAQA